MHMNEYVLETLTRERLAELRAAGECSNRVWAASRSARSPRRALVDLLIRMGRRLRRVRRYAPAMRATGCAINRERTSPHGAVHG
jgi:hypothetical protein